jgi:transcriptional regulator with GAF, ATPase, and Fis domain
MTKATRTGMTVASLSVEERLARLLEINRELAREHELERLLERVIDHAITMLNAERGFVILAKDGELVVHTSRDRKGDDQSARFSRGIAEKVVASGEPVVTLSALSDERMANYLSVHQLNVQSVACVPIRAPDARVAGALYLETRMRPGALFHAELPTLMAFADQVAIAIENAHLVSENQRRANELASANAELLKARNRLEELLGHRTAQLESTRRDLASTRAVLRGHFGYQGLVGTSEKMRRVYALIDRIKDMDVPVLITGESGTGKEIVARAIHTAGSRGKKPFTGLNCGAIPEHLLESELFGHVRGAFTGADRDRKGLFRESEGGTILLDEIGEMPAKMQAGLLRVLQEHVVRPVGGVREETVSVRVIAATHRDLERMVAESAFREDLYYRLHVVEVAIPPLRERTDDIPVLIDHFMQIFAARHRRERKTLTREALRYLSACPWPGNVRQLENVLLNAWVMSDQAELGIEDFELAGLRRNAPVPAAQAPAELRASAEGTLSAHHASEKDRILSALTACNWNRLKAAELIGIPRRTFYRRLKKHGIQ